jgi:diketogulonate reductase-like aldo/keto reductase
MTRSDEIHSGDPHTVSLGGGVVMPLVGLGTWQMSGNSCYRAVRQALDLGYRHIDTATMYRNETEVGRAVRDSGLDRGELFITTKLQASAAGRERRELDASLKALGTEYVDLWLVHWPPQRRALVSCWQELLAAREIGLARSVGVSNYSAGQIDEITNATGVAPSVNQIPWSPFEHDPVALTEHRERGVTLEGYSPLKRSSLRHPLLVRLAEAYGVTPAQVVLRWHLEHGIVVIPKSSDPGRQAENLDLYGFGLTPEEVAEVDALAR